MSADCVMPFYCLTSLTAHIFSPTRDLCSGFSPDPGLPPLPGWCPGRRPMSRSVACPSRPEPSGRADSQPTAPETGTRPGLRLQDTVQTETTRTYRGAPETKQGTQLSIVLRPEYQACEPRISNFV